MAEPSGEEGPSGAVEASAVPAASRRDMPPFRGQSQSAVNLNLLYEMDEPLELMIELERLARERVAHSRGQQRENWDALAEHAKATVIELTILNEPGKR